MRKQNPKAKEATRRRAWLPRMKEYRRSEHPMVNHLRDIEGRDPQYTVMIMEDFQASHCNTKKPTGRLIATLKMEGKVRRWYACDVCGSVGHIDIVAN